MCGWQLKDWLGLVELGGLVMTKAEVGTAGCNLISTAPYFHGDVGEN